jgi:hypothetical protein
LVELENGLILFHFPLLKTFKIVYVCENVPFLTRGEEQEIFCSHNENIYITDISVVCKKLSLQDSTLIALKNTVIMT